MSLLPFLSQFIVPSVLSLYVSFSTFFPIHPIQKAEEHVTKPVRVALKKTTLYESHPTVTATPTDKKTTTGSLHSLPDTSKTTEKSVTSNDKNNEVTPTPTSTQSPTSEVNISQSNSSNTPVTSKTVTAQTSLIMSGKTIHLTMTYPSGGGALSGTMSGDCTGTISGNYDGPSSQSFIGTGNATCPMGFISVPVTINFTGKLVSSSEASINYIVSAMGQTQAGNTMVDLFQ